MFIIWSLVFNEASCLMTKKSRHSTNYDLHFSMYSNNDEVWEWHQYLYNEMFIIYLVWVVCVLYYDMTPLLCRKRWKAYQRVMSTPQWKTGVTRYVSKPLLLVYYHRAEQLRSAREERRKKVSYVCLITWMCTFSVCFSMITI